MVGWLAMVLACKAGEFCCAIDMDFQLTEIWGESKNDSKGQVDPLPALPPQSFESHFEKKQNKTKQNKKCSLYISVQPQDTFSMLYFNQQSHRP